MKQGKKEELSSLDKFRQKVIKDLGKDSIIDAAEVKQEKFSTGNFKLDYELKGGYPKGTIVEFSGYESSGKTTSCIEGTAAFQKKYPNEMVLWLDLEKVFDPIFMQNLGVDISEEKFILLRPATGEKAYEVIKDFCQAFKGGLIVVDSVSLMLPEKEDEGDMGQAQMGSQARMMSQGLRKIFPHVSKSDATLFFVNQLREKIGVSYGSPNTTTGGKALAFYARTRIEVSRTKGNYEETSFGCNMKLVKATYGNEKGKVETHLLKTGGFDNMSDLIDVAVANEVIEKKGSWFAYNGTNLAQGLVATRELLSDNEELVEEIRSKVFGDV